MEWNVSFHWNQTHTHTHTLSEWLRINGRLFIIECRKHQDYTFLVGMVGQLNLLHYLTTWSFQGNYGIHLVIYFKILCWITTKFQFLVRRLIDKWKLVLLLLHLERNVSVSGIYITYVGNNVPMVNCYGNFATVLKLLSRTCPYIYAQIYFQFFS